MIRTFATAAAAVSLALAPVAAQAAPARAAAPVSANEEIGGSPIFLPLLIALAVALGIILLSDGDDAPDSP